MPRKGLGTGLRRAVIRTEGRNEYIWLFCLSPLRIYGKFLTFESTD